MSKRPSREKLLADLVGHNVPTIFQSINTALARGWKIKEAIYAIFDNPARSTRKLLIERYGEAVAVTLLILLKGIGLIDSETEKLAMTREEFARFESIFELPAEA